VPELQPNSLLRERYLHALFASSRLSSCRRHLDGARTGRDVWRPVGAADTTYRFCANAGLQACNWLIEAAAPDTYCVSCRHNRTVPNVSDPVHLAAWQKLEVAKHRLFYSLLRLKLPLETTRPSRFATLPSIFSPGRPRRTERGS